MPPAPPSKFTRGELIAEGKTKEIYSVEKSTDKVIIVSKDKISANNAQVVKHMPDKARMSNITNANVMTYLRDTALIPNAFIEMIDDTSYVATRCKMIPIEWVVRRIATGSFLKRNPGVNEGFLFAPVMVETFFKDDEAGDPLWSKAQVLSIPLKDMHNRKVTEEQYRLMRDTAVAVFEVLERAWNEKKCQLVDMKVEFGLRVDNGDIILSDVIDNDSWRLWQDGRKELMKDKQLFRDSKDHSEEDMERVKRGYQWVMEATGKLRSSVAGGKVVIYTGSTADEPRAKEVAMHCKKLGLLFDRRIMSAHKVTQRTIDSLAIYNATFSPTVIIAIAGRSNGLGPVLAGNTLVPVINCPPRDTEDVWSSLSMPSGLGCSTVLYPEAAALHAAQIFAVHDSTVWAKLRGLQLQRALQLYYDSYHASPKIPGLVGLVLAPPAHLR